MVSLIAAAVGSIVTVKFGYRTWNYFTDIGLLTFFGGYFCLFARQRLPDIYDQTAISFLSDGIVRMNLPGVHLNNQNWPHLLYAGQV